MPPPWRWWGLQVVMWAGCFPADGRSKHDEGAEVLRNPWSGAILVRKTHGIPTHLPFRRVYAGCLNEAPAPRRGGAIAGAEVVSATGVPDRESRSGPRQGRNL